MKSRLLYALAIVFFCIFMPVLANGSAEKKITTTSWQEVAAGLNDNAMIMGLTAAPDGKIYSGSAGKGTFVSSDHGNTWNKIKLKNDAIDNGFTTSIYAHTDGKIYAGQSSGYVFVSRDNGNTFDTLCSIGSGSEGVVSFSSDNDGNIYFITSGGELGIYRTDDTIEKRGRIDSLNTIAWSITVDFQGYIFVSTMGEGIYISTDKGDTWSKTNSGLPSLDVHKVISRFGVIYAGLSGSGGLYMSSDGGLTWKACMNGMGSLIVMDIIFGNVKTIYALTTNDVFRSEDSGQNWTSIKGDLPAQTNYRRLALDNRKYLYTGCATGKIFRTTAPVIAGKGFLSIKVEPTSDINIAPGQSKDFVITIMDKDNEPVENACVWIDDSATSTKTVSYTDRYGKGNYKMNIISGTTELGDYSVTFYAAEPQYENSDTIRRIVHVKNEGSWEKISSYNYNKRVLSILALGKDTLMLGTGGSGLKVSTNSGNDWHDANTGLTNINSIFKIARVPDGSILMSTDWDGLVKTTNFGGTWTKLITGFDMVSHIAATPDGLLFAFDGSGVMKRSTDKGATWQKPAGYPEAIKKVNDVLYINKGLYLAADTAGLYYSSNNGDNWKRLDNGIEGFSSTAINMLNDSTLLMGTYNSGVFTSTDNGNEWMPANSSITDFNITRLIVDGDNVYATAFGKGVWFSANKGSTWSDFNEGLENLSFKDLYGFAVSGDGYIYAGAFDKNLYKRKNTNLPTGVKNENYEKLTLTAYPNPASKFITLSCPVPLKGDISYNLYDEAGSEIQGIQALFSRNNGFIELTYDTGTLQPGVYFCTIKAGNTVMTQKIVIIK